MQCVLYRSAGVPQFPGTAAPKATRRNSVMCFVGYRYQTARRLARAKVIELHPDHLIRSFAMSKTCHAWLVQAPHTGDAIELFVLQPS